MVSTIPEFKQSFLHSAINHALKLVVIINTSMSWAVELLFSLTNLSLLHFRDNSSGLMAHRLELDDEPIP